MLSIPKKHSRSGIQVHCSSCNSQVNGICKKSGKSSKSCQHSDKHKYKAVICIPNSISMSSGNKRITKTFNTKNFDEALEELTKFKKELELNGYHSTPIKPIKGAKLLINLIANYFDYINGVDVPEHLLKENGKTHRKEQVRVLNRLCESLLNNKCLVGKMLVTDIGDREVGYFSSFIKKDLRLGIDGYNRHVKIVIAFYNWLKRFKGMEIQNPFQKITLYSKEKNSKFITNETFNKILCVVNKENGRPENGKNLYRDYLVDIFRLRSECGARREELATMSWSDIRQFEGGGEFIYIDNLKVQRLMNKADSDTMKPIPITKSLKTLLMDLGYEENIGSDEYIIPRPNNVAPAQVMDITSRAFTHYASLVSDKGYIFNDLRDTYISKMSMLLGDKAKIFTGHSNDEIIKKHYLSKQYMASGLGDVDLSEI